MNPTQLTLIAMTICVIVVESCAARYPYTSCKNLRELKDIIKKCENNVWRQPGQVIPTTTRKSTTGSSGATVSALLAIINYTYTMWCVTIVNSKCPPIHGGVRPRAWEFDGDFEVDLDAEMDGDDMTHD